MSRRPRIEVARERHGASVTARASRRVRLAACSPARMPTCRIVPRIGARTVSRAIDASVCATVAHADSRRACATANSSRRVSVSSCETTWLARNDAAARATATTFRAEPFTDEELPLLRQRGIRRLAVFCPSFVSDCLETLEEVAERNREGFLQTGGERFSYVPALNDTPAHAALIAGLAREHIAGW